MHVCMYVRVCMYIYIYIYVHVCIYIYIYIYIFIDRRSDPEAWDPNWVQLLPACRTDLTAQSARAELGGRTSQIVDTLSARLRRLSQIRSPTVSIPRRGA